MVRRFFSSFQKLFDCKLNMSANQCVKNNIKKSKAERETLIEKRIDGTQKLEEKIKTTRPQLVAYLTSKPKMESTIILCYENTSDELVVAIVKLVSVSHYNFYPLHKFVDGATTTDNLLYHKCTCDFDGEKTHFVVLHQPCHEVPRAGGFVCAYYAMDHEIVKFIQKWAKVYDIAFSGKYCYHFGNNYFNYSVRKWFK